MTYENPVPVVVGIVPVMVRPKLIGLLVIRRAIPPGLGLLALPGGFLEIESWRDGLSREVREETGVDIEPYLWACHDWASSEPNPNRVLLFATCAPINFDHIPEYLPENAEVQEIGLLFHHDGLDGEVAFPLHQKRIEILLGHYESFEFNVVAPSGFVPMQEVKDLG